MSNPLMTPEARKHKADVDRAERKIDQYLREWFPEVEMPLGNDERPILRVMPTRDNKGVVRATLDQLAALMGITVAELIDPDTELADVLEGEGER